MEPEIDPEPFRFICRPVPPETFVQHLCRVGFSAAAYNAEYLDIAAQQWPLTEVLGHYFRHGLAERRIAPMTLDPEALVALASLPLADKAFRANLLTNLATHLFAGADHPYGPVISANWPIVRQLARFDACPFFVIGDSHSHQFNIDAALGAAWLVPIHVLCTAGSAMGLGNPHARSRYGGALRTLFQEFDALPGASSVPVLLQFGQVDVEFVHHYQRVRDNQRTLDLAAYRQFCNTVCDRYLQFLCDLFPPHRRPRIFVAGIFPPALSDEAWRSGHLDGDIAVRETRTALEELAAGIRSLQIADIWQRTAIHMDFNAMLRTACGRAGFRFVDAATPFLGADGLLDPRYIQPERFGIDHHLDKRQTHGKISALIWHCIAAARRFP